MPGVASLIGKRLKVRMAEKGYTASRLARNANVKPSFIYDIVNGKSTNPSTVKLASVAEALDVSLSYFIGGGANANADGKGEAADYAPIATLKLEQHGTSLRVQTEEQEAPFCYFHRGFLKMQTGVSPQHLRLIRVVGDSAMPTLAHQDHVLIDISHTRPSPPGLYAIIEDRDIVIRRLEYFEESGEAAVRVICDNARYSSYTRPVDDLMILGRAVWYFRST